MYGFVPSAGAVLAEWGADVVKVEHAVTGDPQRGLRQTGMLRVEGDPNPNIEHANRVQAQHRPGHVGARRQGSALRAGSPVRCVLDQLPARTPEEVRHRRRRHPRGQPEDHLRPRQRARPARRGVGKRRLRHDRVLVSGRDGRHHHPARHPKAWSARPGPPTATPSPAPTWPAASRRRCSSANAPANRRSSMCHCWAADCGRWDTPSR